MFSRNSMMDVIVIGCGAAGIAALRKLHDAGLKVMGLEADDRIGGRIHTIRFGTDYVDIGAAWCDGEKDNIVFDLANPLGLLGRPDPSTNYHILSNGEPLANDVSEQISNAIGEAVKKADKNNTMSILDCVKNAAKTNEILKRNPKLTNSFIYHYERINHLGGEDDSKKGKSLKGLEEYWPSEGESFLNWKGKGYNMILDVLLNKYPDPNKEIPVQILLNKEVESIKWGTNKPGIATNPLVQVKCKDGSLYAARSVVITVSVKILQESHTQLFNPPLPEAKITTINSLQLCVLDKIYIEFARPWWPKSPASFQILWQEEDIAKFDEDDRWITEIVSLETVAHHPNLMFVFIYGKGAEAMEKVSLAKVHASVEKMLTVVMRKQFDVAPIKRVLRSQWASSRFTGGSYAYRSVLTEENGGNGAILLSEPLYHENGLPVVCFAGEATSHHKHSCVHGAVESGFREANRLISALHKS